MLLYLLHLPQLGSSSAEEVSGVLVDAKLNMSQQCAMPQRKLMVFLAVLKYCQHVEGSNPSHCW